MQYIKYAVVFCLLVLPGQLASSKDQSQNHSVGLSSLNEDSLHDMNQQQNHYHQQSDNDCRGCCEGGCSLGDSGYSTSNGTGYFVETLAFPNPTPIAPSIPFSTGFYSGSSQGAVTTTKTGLTINKPGDYLVTFSVILSDQVCDPNYQPVLPIFVVRNGVFDPFTNPQNLELGTTVTPHCNYITNTNGCTSDNFVCPTVRSVSLFETAQGTAILKNVKKNTALSLVIMNGGSPEPAPINVIAWSITAARMPCAPRRNH
jgi:hypothetical protein